jgi:hypothetical protein
MTMEQSIKDTITSKLEDGTVEKLIGEQLEKGVAHALDNLFRSYGDVTKVIEEKIKSVMIPYLESYDYSDYIVKLDSVLVDVLKSSALENKNLLTNFKDLMETSEKLESIKVTDLFEKWMKYVEKNVDTSDLEVDYEDGVRYENVDVRYEVDYNEDKSWSSFEYAVLSFECEKDEKMNFEVRLSRWKQGKDKGYDITYDNKVDMNSLRHMSDLEMMIVKMVQNRTKIIIDQDSDSDEVQPEKEPEASFN